MLAIEQARTLLGVVSLALALSHVPEGAEPEADRCRTGVHEHLYFGLQTPWGELTQHDWESFVARHVEARFPQGFTVLHAQGQWHDGRGTVREASRVLHIVRDDRNDADERVRQIIHHYKRDFAQSSVLRVRSAALACF